MAQRPRILHLGDFDLPGTKPNSETSEAISQFLRLALPGVEIIEADSFTEADLPFYRRLMASGELRLAVVSIHHLCRVGFVNLIHEALPQLPVAFCEGINDEADGYRPSAHLHRCQDFGRDFLRLAENLTASWRQQDWLGWAGDDRAEELGKSALLRWHEQSDRSHELGTPTDDHRITAAALRLKLLPCSALAEDFDASLPEPPPLDVAAALEEYEQAMSVLRSLGLVQRGNLLSYLRNETEGIDLGPNVNGLAVELSTGQMLVTRGQGTHRDALRRLGHRFEQILDLESRTRRVHDRYHLVAGLIVRRCPYVTLPMAIFAGMDLETGQPLLTMETRRQLAYLLRRDGRFVPVDHEGQLIEV